MKRWIAMLLSLALMLSLLAGCGSEEKPQQGNAPGEETEAKEEKLKMICEVFEDKVSDVVLNFMCVLTENGRLINFGEIFLEFKKLYFEHIGIVEVEVITTAQLSERLVQKLKDKLSKQLNKQVILDTKIDEKLLGGIVIKYDNKQIDGSLRRKLADIKSSIDSVIA